jgi:hypothetical protein
MSSDRRARRSAHLLGMASSWPEPSRESGVDAICAELTRASGALAGEAIAPDPTRASGALTGAAIAPE